MSKFDEIYPDNNFKDKIEASNHSKSLQLDHSIFSSVRYSIDSKSESNKIISIDFNIGFWDLESNSEILLKRLRESLGSPKKWSDKDKFSWSDAADVNVYFDNVLGLTILNKNYLPSYWPEE